MVKIEWVEIPAGEFPAGLSEQQADDIRAKVRAEAGVDGNLDARQVPRVRQVEKELELVPARRTVSLPTFYIARFPVTHEQMGEFSAAFSGNAALQQHRLYLDERYDPPDFPEQAYWDIADVVCHWVGGRLPTALEWEKAARGTDGRLYPWGDEWDPSRGNLIPSVNSSGRPARARDVPGWVTPVDGYPSGVSPYGVWDMAGNLRERTMTAVEQWVKVKADEWKVRQTFAIKGDSPKDLPAPSWYYHILPRQMNWTVDTRPWYVGFRPVKDGWQQEHWMGFGSGSDRA